MATHRHISLPAGDVLVIEMQSRPHLLAGNHVHACPVCYEHWSCEHTCSIETDLTLDDGTLCGAHCVCPACEEDTRR